MIIHNIETIDGLTNGQFGILKEVTYKEDEKTVDKLIIQLRNSRAGEMNRQKTSPSGLKIPKMCHN